MAEARKPIILDVDTGYETVQIRDHGEIIGEFKFNPADSNIATRYMEVAKHFGEMQITEDTGDAEQNEEIRKVCDDIKTQFDYLFGGNVSDGIFGNCGPLSVTSNGELYFTYILEKIGGIIDTVLDKRTAEKMERVRQAVGEYADAPTMAPLA